MQDMVQAVYMRQRNRRTGSCMEASEMGQPCPNSAFFGKPRLIVQCRVSIRFESLSIPGVMEAC
jgi:hypothetical protein